MDSFSHFKRLEQSGFPDGVHVSQDQFFDLGVVDEVFKSVRDAFGLAPGGEGLGVGDYDGYELGLEGLAVDVDLHDWGGADVDVFDLFWGDVLALG